MARKNKKQRKHPKFWFGFKIVLLLFLLTILVGGIIFYFKYGKDIFAMQDDAVALVKESSIDTFRSSETSTVYNNKGKEIARLLLPYLGQNTKGGKGCSNCYRRQKVLLT